MAHRNTRTIRLDCFGVKVFLCRMCELSPRRAVCIVWRRVRYGVNQRSVQMPVNTRTGSMGLARLRVGGIGLLARHILSKSVTFIEEGYLN